MAKLSKDTDKHLPPEIIFELLIRMPAEELVELKRVCKLWLSLISSRDFIKSHLQHWKSKLPKIIIGKVNHFSSIDLISKAKHGLFRFVDWDVEVLDSLDGLILIQATQLSFSGKKEFALSIYNPVTRKSKSLVRIPYYGMIVNAHFKLVFDPLLRKYKVLGFVFCSEKFVSYTVLSIDIDEGGGTFWNINWKPPEFEFRHNSHGEFISVLRNGVLYWIAEDIIYKNYEEREVFIQSMDIVEEKFKGRIALPGESKKLYWPMCGLLEIESIKGSLCVAIRSDSDKFCIWVLDDWDKQDWVLKHTVCLGFAVGSNTRSFLYYIDSIILVTDIREANGSNQMKLFVEREGKLCSYCLWNQKFEEISDFPTRVTYVPSLVHWK